VENNEETKFTVVIDHGEGWATYYSHLEQVMVKEGQTVKFGTKIGQAGDISFLIRVRRQEMSLFGFVFDRFFLKKLSFF